MSPLNLLLWGGGVVLIAVGYLRARGPWRRYQALRDQQANVARYESWRGGVRSADTTTYSVEQYLLRRQARAGAIIAGVGFALVFAGFFIR